MLSGGALFGCRHCATRHTGRHQSAAGARGRASPQASPLRGRRNRTGRQSLREAARGAAGPRAREASARRPHARLAQLPTLRERAARVSLAPAVPARPGHVAARAARRPSLAPSCVACARAHHRRRTGSAGGRGTRSARTGPLAVGLAHGRRSHAAAQSARSGVPLAVRLPGSDGQLGRAPGRPEFAASPLAQLLHADGRRRGGAVRQTAAAHAPLPVGLLSHHRRGAATHRHAQTPRTVGPLGLLSAAQRPGASALAAASALAESAGLPHAAVGRGSCARFTPAHRAQPERLCGALQCLALGGTVHTALSALARSALGAVAHRRRTAYPVLARCAPAPGSLALSCAAG
mmetsp:Transcript_5924/g.18147  ORF Transcript_5924/g.18147 Transcript_5924/m.18147 type:complete len:349 (+) Transcript_5924:812-1858(+)